jgi:isopentenyl-diphosphate Delta-isomerase
VTGLSQVASERFEIFDDRGSRVGVADRDRVHREGLWHRAAHVWLFCSDGRLWIQRRAQNKDICAGRWDFSVGEHLQPGETFAAAAARGLQEELRVTDVDLAPIGPCRRVRYEDARRGIRDWEETRSFTGCYDGPVCPDAAEVDAVQQIDMSALADWMLRAPETFTPWFLHEARELGMLDHD